LLNEIPLTVVVNVFNSQVFLTKGVEYEIPFVVVDLCPSGSASNVPWEIVFDASVECEGLES